MHRALFAILFICACGPNQFEHDEGRKILINPSRLEIYLYDSDAEDECAKYLENPELRSQKKPDFVRHSWADFETDGLATLQIDHLRSSKKVLVFVIAIDPTTNEVIGQGCAQNIEIEKGVLREVELVLHKTLRQETKE